MGWVLWALLQIPVTSTEQNGPGPSWTATAYCKGTTTFAGVRVQRGMAASDPSVLPTGSIVRVRGTGDPRWDGVYSVLDTGPAITGRILDLYMWSCVEALDFGRRPIQVDVIRFGWRPNKYTGR